MSRCSGSEDLLWQFEKEVSRVSKVSPDQAFQQDICFFWGGVRNFQNQYDMCFFFMESI